MPTPITITQPGYVYIYLSNENSTPVEVYFDDLTITQIKSPVVETTDYYPFGLVAQNFQRESEVPQNFKYNGKEQINDLALDWTDYGARMYMPEIGRWGVPDPMAELGFSLTPYRYCYNNPVNYTDPFGLWEQSASGWSTTDAGDISRFLNYLQVETKPTMGNIDNFIKGEESEGGAGLGRLSDGSKLASEVKVNGYKEGNHVNWVTDKKSFDNMWHGIQGDMTPNALDPRTVGKQFPFGLTYPGPTNPRTYSGKFDYTYVPLNLAEYPGIGHDRRYDNLKITGASGLFTDSRAIGADWQFVSEEFLIATISTNPAVKFQAAFFGGVLGASASVKTLIKLATPQGVAETAAWYSISNQGVSNAPDKPQQ
jgi:RHS repeat-associated protein